MARGAGGAALATPGPLRIETWKLRRSGAVSNQTDSFISEVTEEVRRDRLFAIFRKYGWIGVVAVIGIVGGASWYEWQKVRHSENAQAFGDQLLAALQSEHPQQLLDGMTATGTQGALVRLASAAQAMRDGNPDQAYAALKAAADDAALPENLRQLALLKAVMLDGQMPAAEREAALAELTKPGAPYRLMAIEQRAIAALAAGDTAGVIAGAEEILADSGATPGLQQRATELIVALGGEPPAPIRMPAAAMAE
ncbi:tetratricopeptide repeat protein [Sinirhodobacter populi]|uniref:Tetratricopeptide repeat protein n=1 Tax=Paenirhodobacter populi TaxID=2306993 RepID=A0A451GCJ5_9RHOB|nr:tetratricopeptide repeat protein [Sinirhodobacter populi]